MAALVPKPLSPRAHRRFDMLALPGMLALAAWLFRRNRTAAAVMLTNAAIEGTAFLTTDYPPGILRWMSFRDHLRVADAHGAFVAALALTLRDLSPRERRMFLAFAAVPVVLGALSDTGEGRRSS